MRTAPTVFSGLAALAAVLVAGGVRAAPGSHKVHGRIDLESPTGMDPPGPSGRVHLEIRPAEGVHPESSRLRIDLKRLVANSAFTLWADDPSTADTTLVEFGDASTNRGGRARFSRDTRRGDTLPFDAAAEDLAGLALEVHDASGAVVLAGTFPTPEEPPPREPTLRGRSDLERPAAAPLPLATGRIDAQVRPAFGTFPGSSRLRIDLRGLSPGVTFTLWGDDPATADATLTEFGSLTANLIGRAKGEFDARKGDTLPFGATLEDLAGLAVEVHDAADAIVLSGLFPTPAAPPPHEPTLHGRSELAPPPDAPPVARGRIHAESRPARGDDPASSRLTIDLRGLVGGENYTLWSDDPSTADTALTEFGSVTASKNGKAKFRVDTRKGGALPFDAALVDLAGQAVEVRDAAGAVVLSGFFPALD